MSNVKFDTAYLSLSPRSTPPLCWCILDKLF